MVGGGDKETKLDDTIKNFTFDRFRGLIYAREEKRLDEYSKTQWRINYLDGQSGSRGNITAHIAGTSATDIESSPSGWFALRMKGLTVATEEKKEEKKGSEPKKDGEGVLFQAIGYQPTFPNKKTKEHMSWVSKDSLILSGFFLLVIAIVVEFLSWAHTGGMHIGMVAQLIVIGVPLLLLLITICLPDSVFEDKVMSLYPDPFYDKELVKQIKCNINNNSQNNERTMVRDSTQMVAVPYFISRYSGNRVDRDGLGHWVVVIFCRDGQVLYCDSIEGEFQTMKNRHSFFHTEQLQAMYDHIYASPSRAGKTQNSLVHGSTKQAIKIKSVQDLTDKMIFQRCGNTCADWVEIFSLWLGLQCKYQAEASDETKGQTDFSASSKSDKDQGSKAMSGYNLQELMDLCSDRPINLLSKEFFQEKKEALEEKGEHDRLYKMVRDMAELSLPEKIRMLDFELTWKIKVDYYDRLSSYKTHKDDHVPPLTWVERIKRLLSLRQEMGQLTGFGKEFKTKKQASSGPMGSSKLNKEEDKQPIKVQINNHENGQGSDENNMRTK